MSDTEVPVLGGMLPAGWSRAMLSQVTSKVGSGATPRGGSSVYVDSGVTFIRSQNIHDHSFKRAGIAYIDDESAHKLRAVEVAAGDVLMNITGDSILRTTLVDPNVLPARVNQHVAILRSNGEVEPRFLQKWLSLPAMKEYMLGHSSGGTRKAVTKAHILSFPIPLPPLDEQNRIATTLGALDGKIESNHRQIETIFSIVEGLGRIEAKNTPRTVLSNISTLQRKASPIARLAGSLVDHYSLPAFDIDAHPVREMADEIKSNKIILETPCVLVSRLNPKTNRTWWVNPSLEVLSLCSTEFAVLQPAAGIDLAAVWLAVSDNDFQERMRASVTGTSGSHQRVAPLTIMRLEVPDFRTADPSVIKTVADLLSRTDMLKLENVCLAALRNALLPELLSGKIRTIEFEDTVEEALT